MTTHTDSHTTEAHDSLYHRLSWAYDLYMTPLGWHRMMDRYSLEGLRPGKLLDVGCGTGRLVGRAKKAGFDAYGIDPAQGMVEEARKSTGLGADHFGVGLAEHIPFPNESFDIVITCGALLHVPDITAAAQEMARVVRKGGTIRMLEYDHPARKSPYTQVVKVWTKVCDYQVHDYQKAFEPACRLESHKVIGRGGYLQRFDFRK